MKYDNLKSAIAEAERFLERAKIFKKILDEDKKSPCHIFSWEHRRESGATRRASMDLTRALAELRKYQ